MSAQSNRRFALKTLACGAFALLAGASLYAAGLRVNATASLPPGVWLIRHSPAVPTPGAIINFCPPQVPAIAVALDRNYLADGLCPGGYETLFKPVIAVAGDIVVVTDTGVFVNGKPVPNSTPISRDGAGAAMPTIRRGRHIVSRGEVWTVSSYTPWSFDSRYFGPVPTANIRGTAVPLWTTDPNWRSP